MTLQMNSQETLWIQDIINSVPASEAKNDAQRAFEHGKETLESLFTTWLWLEEGFEYANDKDKFYAIDLGVIEERLVEQSLIYQ
jgi:hypothetical protein